MDNVAKISEIISKYEAEILAEWLNEVISNTNRHGLLKETELQDECREFLHLMRQALQQGNLTDIQGLEWNGVREILVNISHLRSQKGFSSSETASFVFCLKKPLFKRLEQSLAADHALLIDEISQVSNLLDKLGLFATEVYQKAREAVIRRQQEELLELSTPVVKLWDGILALPLIGTLDSARTQIVMESLLTRIVETGSEVAIIDITGVPTVDTLTAQHLLKTITAARLMGADCIISGIRPPIAQTIVYLGIDLTGIITKSTLADAFALALQRIGMKINRTQG